MNNLLNINILTISLVAFSTLNVHAQKTKKTVETEFKVFGNCDQCKNRIEGALDVSGVKFAEWNKTTKMLTVAYRTNKLTEEKLAELVHATGHDTEEGKADDSTYAELPECCKFRDNHNHTTH